MEELIYEPLSAAETKIAIHLENGLSRAQAAEAEGCSIHTVHTHCRNMFRKMGVNNVTGLLKKLKEKRSASFTELPSIG
jgi:DNA-binding CsgD family transcriptional regulator